MRRILAAVIGVARGLRRRCGPRATSVISASPQGEVATVRQVRVRFSEAVVPFGDLRQADPFAVVCQGQSLVGHGRWVDSQSWVYEFDGDIGPGVRCTARLRPEWKPDPRAASAAASAAAQQASSAKDCADQRGRRNSRSPPGAPRCGSIEPSGGEEIEEDQNFLLHLSGPVVDATVADQRLVRGRRAR